MDKLTEEQISQSVAIIGMSGRFPGADTIADFWANLVEGKCCVEQLNDNTLRNLGVPEEILNNSRCIKRAGILHNSDMFASSFFGYSPREAELIDPQQRIFLECAWEAFEDAGYTPESTGGSVGVFAGAGMNYYFVKNILSQKKRFEDIVNLLTFIGNDKDHLCSRVSYKLGLNGPSYAVNSACSTSLVAIQVGYQSLLTGQCNYALCGGVSLQSPRSRASLYTEGEIFSPDGLCKTFDKNADGIVFGEGVGVVLLKRAEDAIQDRDHIYAIIRSAVVNNDGAEKIGYTAPGFDSQAKLVALAQEMADVNPEEISFIEAHGTATRLGDAIEISALTKAFRRKTDKRQFCAIGSVKTNIGHLDTAAGVTGLIKTALALKNRTLPATINFTEDNPELRLPESPFIVAKENVSWKNTNKPLIAGISSLGMGGTNAHIIMHEPPLRKVSEKNREWYLIPLSAHTETELTNMLGQMHQFIIKNESLRIQDIAYTLQTGRRAFNNRWYAVCAETGDLIKVLNVNVNKAEEKIPESISRTVIFAFSGQGSQYPGMALNLYNSEPIIQEVLDEAREIMLEETGEDLFRFLFPQDTNSPDAAEMLTRTRFTQPALFAVEYAIARLFISFGITPAACIGHSIGEFTAAAIANVFSFRDGMKIVINRAKFMDTMPEGSMAYISLSEKELAQHIFGTIVIALVNAPESCVISGPVSEITSFIESMKKKNIRCGLLKTSHAFHSPLMDKAAMEFREYLDNITLCKPTIPFISNVSGTWITDIQCTDSSYWADQLRNTVRFSDGITELSKQKNPVFIEIGPGNTLSTLIQMHFPGPESAITIQSLPQVNQKTSDCFLFVDAIGKLWSSGLTIDWMQFYHTEVPNRIPLPSYQFQRERHWIEYCGQECNTSSDVIVNSTSVPVTEGTLVNKHHTESVPQIIDIASRDQIYKIVSDAWHSVLGISNCTPDDSFIDLGGNSLMLTQVVARINERLPYILHMSFLMGSYTINEQVEHLLEFGRSNPDSISQTVNEPIQHTEVNTLSPAQKRLWYLCQLNRHTPAFNLTHTFRLKGILNIPRLENAVNAIIQRHPSLRSTFLDVNGIPAVNLSDSITVSLSAVNCISTDNSHSEKQAAEHIKNEAAVLYDLEQGPLFKCGLYRVSNSEHIFVFYIHHIISDGWSMAIILKELSALYNLSQDKHHAVLEPLKINYFDYAAYMNRIEDRPLNDTDVAFWKDYFKTGLPILSLPTDFQRPKTLKFTAKLLTFTLPPELMRKITAYAGAKKITPFSILLSVYGLMLHRNARQERIIIGCPIAGRNRVEFESLIGLFLNMLPFNIRFDSDMTIENLANETYQNTMQVFAHQNIQFGKLVELLQPERHLNVNHVFQTMFSYNNYLFSANTTGEVIFEPEKSDRGSSEYDLSLYMWSSDDTLHGAFEYSDELFLESTIEGFRSQFQTLLEAAIANPLLPISKAPVFTNSQLKELLEQKYSTTCDVPSNETLISLFDKSFNNYRSSVAITDGMTKITYSELYNLSCKICNGLLSAGVSCGTVVGIHMSRSVNIIPVLLGVLRAGATYIPLDPAFPEDRIDFIVNDAEIKYIVADLKNGKRFTENEKFKVLTHDDTVSDFTLCTNSSDSNYCNEDSIAYILYTSGSTGTPKGVEIQHKALTNFLLSMLKRPGISNSDNLLSVTSISFDISGLEFFLPLLAGAKITLTDNATAADAFELRRILERSEITIMQATPTTWRMLLESGWTNGENLKILCGGEALSRELADRLLSTGAELWNMYGPTETTIWSSICRVTNADTEPDIGFPIDNTQFFFLDEALQEVPRGVIAELCIGGSGLAKGYHKRPDLTNKKFVYINIDGSEIRVYRTGDLVRVKADGKIEFLGRTDHQVKIRGYRIELDEIGTVLNRHHSVAQAIVSTFEKSSIKDLVAYIRPQPGNKIDTTAIREFLGKQLPSYMVPATFLIIDEFPLTPNGKIDRKRLPKPDLSDHSTNADLISKTTPRDSLEVTLVKIWERFIEKEIKSIDDNYFDLGGHSLLAVQIFNELHKEFNLQLPLAVLIEYPTVRAFATYLRELLHLPEYKEINTSQEPAGKPKVSTPVHNLQIGYNIHGQPVWLTTSDNPGNSVVPVFETEKLPDNPFSVREKVLPSIPSQEEIWKLLQTNPEVNSAFNIAISINIQGKINTDAFDNAIQGLSVIHEILRAHFTHNGKKIIIKQDMQIPVSRCIIDSVNDDDRTAKINSSEIDEIKNIFDINNGPLFRVAIISSTNNNHTIILVAHSSMIDNWSLAVLKDDLISLYLSFAAINPPCSLPQYQYGDFSQHCMKPEVISQRQTSIMYWHYRLALPPLPYPPKPIFYEKQQNSLQYSSNSFIITRAFNADIFHKINAFAKNNCVTVFAVLLAGLSKQIQRHTGTDDITIGVPFATQCAYTMTTTTGKFDSLLPVRIQSGKCNNFIELCHHCHKSLFTDYSNAFAGIEDLRMELGFSQFKAHSLVAARCSYVRLNNNRQSEELQYSTRYITHQCTTANLEISFYENSDSIEITAIGNSCLTEQLWITSFVNDLEKQFDLDCMAVSDIVKHEKTFSAPANKEETILLEIWKRLFDNIAIETNVSFFALGGDSLSAFSMLDEVNRYFKVTLQPSILTTYSTISTLATHIQSLVKSSDSVPETAEPLAKKSTWNTVVPFNREGELPPFFCVSGLGGNPMIFLHLSKLLGKNQPFYALQFRGVDGIMTPHNRVEDMAEEFLNDIRKVHPEGPYYLGGYSFGGLVAYEIIQRLLKNGDSVGGLVLIDTFIPHFSKLTLKKKLLTRLSNLIPTGSGYNIKKFSHRLRSHILQVKTQPDLSNTFKNRFDLVASCNHQAGVNYKPLQMKANVVFVKSALPVPPDRYGHKLPFHSINEWGNLIPSDLLDLRYTQAHHYEILVEPNLSETAKNISAGLTALRNRYNRNETVKAS